MPLVVSFFVILFDLGKGHREGQGQCYLWSARPTNYCVWSDSWCLKTKKLRLILKINENANDDDATVDQNTLMVFVVFFLKKKEQMGLESVYVFVQIRAENPKAPCKNVWWYLQTTAVNEGD